MKNPLLRLLPLLLLAALAVAACGGSDEEAVSDAVASAETAAESAIGGGEAVCDQATFDAWVKAYGEQADVNGATLAKDGFTCADGWAVLTPTVGTNDPNASFDETVVVQAEGPVWALMQRDKVCGADAASSEVPESLYEAACQTS